MGADICWGSQRWVWRSTDSCHFKSPCLRRWGVWSHIRATADAHMRRLLLDRPMGIMEDDRKERKLSSLSIMHESQCLGLMTDWLGHAYKEKKWTHSMTWLSRAQSQNEERTWRATESIELSTINQSINRRRTTPLRRSHLPLWSRQYYYSIANVFMSRTYWIAKPQDWDQTSRFWLWYVWYHDQSVNVLGFIRPSFRSMFRLRKGCRLNRPIGSKYPKKISRTALLSPSRCGS
jgi:hypothetical protein